jgi:phosphoribosyl 1,2-cyclic phosphate phosphodiesterase
MQVLFLGSGTSHGVPMIGCDCPVCRSDDPRNRRTRASVLIRERGVSLLIDASVDLRQQALCNGVRRVDAILLTHSHADHVLGLDDVRAFSAVQNAPVPVYGDAHTLEVVRRNLDYVFRRPRGRPDRNIPRLVLFMMDTRAEVCGVTVIAVPIFHGRRTILGYRIGRFAYLTDCSGVPDESFNLLEGLDTVVVGAIRRDPHPKHFSLSQALALLERLRPRQAYITHISHRLDHATIEAGLPSGVRLAYDGLQIEVPD